MHPRLIEQVAAAHVNDLRRTADLRRSTPEEDLPAIQLAPAPLRPRVGSFLIRTGIRLGGLDGPGWHPAHS